MHDACSVSGLNICTGSETSGQIQEYLIGGGTNFWFRRDCTVELFCDQTFKAIYQLAPSYIRNLVRLIIVIELSGVQFGLKSYS